MRTAVQWWDRFQVLLYLIAIAVGAVTGLAFPSIAPGLEASSEPVLMLLLFATFLGVPLIEAGRAVRDVRFLGTVLIVNFIGVPLVVWGLSRFVADDRGLLVGVLLVLLTPCIDYVIVFTGLAGGASGKLLAATPLLMLAQILLLPVYLFLFAGEDALSVIDIAPFAEAFLTLIVVPLIAAASVQALARRHAIGHAVEEVMDAAMVPLMMATLAAVVGSQIAAVGSQVGTLVRVLPIYVVFAAIMVAVGRFAGVLAHLDAASTRAVMFSVATRNSLVVLPLALALPNSLSIAPLAVVAQTLVELIVMVILVRLAPLIARGPSPANTDSIES